MDWSSQSVPSEPLITATVAVVLSVATMLILTGPANAQDRKIAACKQLSDNTTQTPDVNAWMNAQLSDGKTGFVSHGSFLCAW